MLQGFRGTSAGIEATCARTCKWYNSLTAEKLAQYRTARANPLSPLREILTEDDEAAFATRCAETGSADYGFPGATHGTTFCLGGATDVTQLIALYPCYLTDGCFSGLPLIAYSSVSLVLLYDRFLQGPAAVFIGDMYTIYFVTVA